MRCSSERSSYQIVRRRANQALGYWPDLAQLLRFWKKKVHDQSLSRGTLVLLVVRPIADHSAILCVASQAFHAREQLAR